MTWHPNPGGSCPVHEDAVVRVKFSCGRLSAHEYRAGGLNWSLRSWPYDIANYQVVSSPADEEAAWNSKSGGY